MKNTDSHEIATGLRQEYMPAPLGYTIYMGKIAPEEKITIENIKWYFLTISSSFTKKKKKTSGKCMGIHKFKAYVHRIFLSQNSP